jgi:hypothetical protein
MREKYGAVNMNIDAITLLGLAISANVLSSIKYQALETFES